MSEQKIIVQPQGDTIKILTGNLPTPLADRDERLQSTKWEGNIGTPGTMLLHPNKYFTTEKTVVQVDRQNKTIEAWSNPGEAVNHYVKGTITLNKELEILRIGEKKAFTQDDFTELLRKDGKRFFPNVSELTTLIGAVKGFAAKVNAQLENSKDQRGNVNQIYKKKVEVPGFPENITIEVPIFKADVPVTFVLDVNYDVLDSGIYFWFDSTDYKKLVQDGVNALIDGCLMQIGEASGFTVIEK
jgi:hypothetical protein